MSINIIANTTDINTTREKSLIIRIVGFLGLEIRRCGKMATGLLKRGTIDDIQQ
jgi:hypothetical protein